MPTHDEDRSTPPGNTTTTVDDSRRFSIGRATRSAC
jgi:hypothetical protein